MKNKPEMIVMLTHNDNTVKNAYKIFNENKDAKAKYWGFKEKSLPPDEMVKLYAHMKNCGKTTFLEVVQYDEKSCLEAAKLAVDCKCDILMGTIYSDEILNICKSNNMKYMPFVGNVTQIPSVLDGSIDDMIKEANEYIKKGVYGIDLLGYRYTGDASKLIRRFVAEVDVPVCVAGSINSFEKLDEILEVSPWTFTIGSAFFENKFGNAFVEQINRVHDYVNKGEL